MPTYYESDFSLFQLKKNVKRRKEKKPIKTTN